MNPRSAQPHQACPQTVQLQIRDRDEHTAFRGLKFVGKRLKGHDWEASKGLTPEIRLLNAERDDLVGRVVLEILVCDLGEEAVADYHKALGRIRQGHSKTRLHAGWPSAALTAGEPPTRGTRRPVLERAAQV